jgi:D-lactate dehydrogenase
MGNLIKVVGIGSFVCLLWDVKLKIAAMQFDGSDLICDKLLYWFNNFTPAILPARFMDSGKKYDHHMAVSIGDFGEGELQRCLDRIETFEKENKGKILIQECKDGGEDMSLTAFRFVAAPAFRTWCVGNGVQGFSVDYAMPKNSSETPPLAKDAKEVKPLKRMRYSHFGCNVVHEDLAFDLDADVHAIHMDLKKNVSATGGSLPAEHGHGTEYKAPKSSQDRWMKMDPLNVLNPGIGGLSSKFRYKDE